MLNYLIYLCDQLFCQKLITNGKKEKTISQIAKLLQRHVKPGATGDKIVISSY